VFEWLRNFLRPTIRMEARYTYNGKPATPEQRKEMDAMLEDIDRFFRRLDDLFDRLDKEPIK